MGDLDTVSLFFSLPDGIFISSVRATTTELVVRIACQRSCAACPLCQQTSERVHGNYVRTVADLPCGGRRVILALTVRKFVCSAPTCPRQIFTERLPDLVQSYARMTNRLREALVALGLATSAQVLTVKHCSTHWLITGAVLSPRRCLQMLMVGLLSTVAFHGHHIQDHAVVDHPVDSGHGGHRIFKDALPFAEDQIGSNHYRFVFIALGQEGKEDLHLIAVVLHIANVIEDDTGKFVQLGQFLW